MVMKLKESETKLESMLVDNVEVPAEESDGVVIVEIQASDSSVGDRNEQTEETSFTPDITNKIKNTTDIINNNLKKVTNIENEQLNKSMHSIRLEEEGHSQEEGNKRADGVDLQTSAPDNSETAENSTAIQVKEQPEIRKDDKELNELLRKNILSCVDKITRIEELKNKKNDTNKCSDQVLFVNVNYGVCPSVVSR